MIADAHDPYCHHQDLISRRLSDVETVIALVLGPVEAKRMLDRERDEAMRQLEIETTHILDPQPLDA